MPHHAVPCEEPKEDAAEMLDVEDMDVDDEPHLDFRCSHVIVYCSTSHALEWNSKELSTPSITWLSAALAWNRSCYGCRMTRCCGGD